nr:MAG TPA: hypothetical protein [Caudoviricetes sp.]
MTEKWYQIAQAQLVDLANEELVGDRILRPRPRGTRKLSALCGNPLKKSSGSPSSLKMRARRLRH